MVRSAFIPGAMFSFACLVLVPVVGRSSDVDTVSLDGRQGIANPGGSAVQEPYNRAVGLAGPTETRVRTADGKEARSIDGTGNNVANPTWGCVGQRLLRMGPAYYDDLVSMPAGTDRPSPRVVSNAVFAQAESVLNSRGATDFVWMWGQLLDHDLDLVPTTDPPESFPIPVPMGDPHFDPSGTGAQTIPLNRSVYNPASGTVPGNPREQINVLTAFIDASNVYGSDTVRAAALRTNDGTGRLKTSTGNLLPFNTLGLPNAGGTSPSLFVAGDVRANEQVGLTSLHTLFVREHNRLADSIRAAEPSLADDEIYERARAIVGAQMQVITYREFLPVLLGPNAFPPYQGYNPAINPEILNVFAAACYRLGHSMLSPQLARTDAHGAEIAEGHLPLRDAFFFPASRLLSEGGIDPILRGAAMQAQQEVDSLVVDDVRNFLFGPPGSGGLDLTSLNMQRGRDHGLPSYNQTRVEFGLSPTSSFADITRNEQVQARLQSVYGNVDQVDLWVGAVAEDHVPQALVGELLFTVLRDQFLRLRDGDRFWYQRMFSGDELAELENTRLSEIIRRNTTIGAEIQDAAFILPSSVIPTVSTWGLAVLALLLLTGGSLLLRARRVSLSD